MILHSIKWRLQAWHGFLLVCLVAGLMTGFYAFERRVRLDALDDDLDELMIPLRPRLAPPGGRDFGEPGPGERGRRPLPPELGGPPPEERLFRGGPPPGREREPVPFNSGKAYYVAWNPDGLRFAASTNAPADLACPHPGGVKGGRQFRTRGEFRELLHVVPSGTCVLVGAPLTPALAQLRQLAVALGLIGCGIVATGGAVGWWLANRALRPIAEISQAAQEIAAGDLARRINPSETESELGQLTTVLNSTFARLEAAFAQQQQFTSDAAHELRTPVSVILTQVQSTLNKERSGADYRETLLACERAAVRMKRLIESLLELARFDAGQEQLKQLPFNLAATVREALALIQPLVAAKQLTLASELLPVSCTGDAGRIGQVIANLLTNAVNYNQPGGEVRVSTRNESGVAVLTVFNTGPGIPAGDLPRVFERFYRVDPARANGDGGSGLGLAICKAIVQAHGGEIHAASDAAKGTTFTVRLPTG